MESKVKAAFEKLDGDLAGTYYHLKGMTKKKYKINSSKIISYSKKVIDSSLDKSLETANARASKYYSTAQVLNVFFRSFFC